MDILNHVIAYLRSQHRILVNQNDLKQADFIVDELIHRPERVKSLVDCQGQLMAVCSDVVTGTIFGKRYSVLAMGLFDVLNQFGIIMDGSPHHVGLKLIEDGRMAYSIPEHALISVQDITPDQLRSFVLSFVYDHIDPLFQTVATYSGSEKSHMLSLKQMFTTVCGRQAASYLLVL